MNKEFPNYIKELDRALNLEEYRAFFIPEI
jgi:hypothetical protein